MNKKIKITTSLTKDDVEEILRDYFANDGYNVSNFDYKLENPITFTGVDASWYRLCLGK